MPRRPAPTPAALRALCVALTTWACACGGVMVDESEPPEPPEPLADAAPKPLPEPAFAGCGALDVAYLRDADKVDVGLLHHALVVDVDGSAGRLVVTDTLRVVARSQATGLLLQVSPALELTQAFRVQPAEVAGVSMACQLGEQHGAPMLRLALDAPLAAGQEAEVRLRFLSRESVLRLATPRAEPLLIDRVGQLAAASTYLADGSWVPSLLEPEPVEATLVVTVPAGQTAVASGRPMADGSVSLSPAPRRPVPLGLAVGPAEHVHSAELAGATRVTFLASERSAAPDDVLALLVDMVGYLETAMGPWPWGSVALAEVLPEQGEALAATVGLVMMSPGALQDPTQGASFLFDLLTRQWLESLTAIEPRLQEGIIQYLSIRYAARVKDPEVGDPLAPFAELKARYLAAVEGGDDVPIASLGLVDPLFVPIAYGKVGTVLQTLHETLGDDVFHAGLRAFVATGAESSDEALLGVDALQRAMETAAGRSLASFFDFYFRATGPLRVTAQCAGGKTRLKQKGERVLPLRFSAVIGGQAVVVAFDDSASLVVDAPCKKQPDVRIPHALVVVVK